MRSEDYSTWSVCVCVCVCDYSRTTGYEAAYDAIPTASVLQGQEIKCSDFAETTAFENYGVKQAKKPIYIMSTGLPRPRSAHRGRIKFLRGYVSKSSAALNPLAITL